MDYNKKNVTDIDVTGKKVLLRCDFNVPMAKDGSGVTGRQAHSCALCRPSSICWSMMLPLSHAPIWVSRRASGSRSCLWHRLQSA